MKKHEFTSLTDFIGISLPYFSTHADLVERQRAAKIERAGRRNRDNEWKGEIARETDDLSTN